MTPNNWTLNSYTNSTWTDLLTASSDTVIKAISIAGGSNAAEVKVRLANSGGTSLAVLVPSGSVAANSANEVEFLALTVKNGQKLQVWASASGVEFAAFGAS
jgi:protein involved in polysaccharide export with SLBB domain